MNSDRLFEDRVPEAAARQLATVLAWATECHLATLANLPKRTSKSERARHQSIADQLVFHCAELKVDPRGLLGRPCPRLARLLEARTETGDKR